MIILGLPSSHHSAWGIVKDGKVLRAILESRLNRIKHYPYYTNLKENPMTLGLEYLLRGQNFSVGDIDVATIPVLPKDSKFHHLDIVEMDSIDDVIQTNAAPWYSAILEFIKSEGFKGKIVFVNHQLSHASYAYNLSGYKECDVLSYDGAGCGWPPEVVVGFHVNSHRYNRLFSVRVPHSLGHVYSNTTNRIFGNRSDGCEGKVMGLAPYGVPDERLTMLKLDENSETYISTYPSTTKIQYSGIEPHSSIFGLRQQNIPQRENKKKWNFDDESDMFYANLAASAQRSVENAGMYYAKKLLDETGSDNLCLVGGVALNSCLNGKIRRSGIYKNVFAGPACHDGGHAIGAPLYYSNLKNPKKTERLKDDFFGYPYSDDECLSAAEEFNLTYSSFNNTESLSADIAKSIADKKIIAIFNKGSELGPRALGHRSIVVDPRTPEMKDTLNARVKFREAYRPFAPFVLQDYASDYFEFKDSEFMLFVAKATEKAKKEVPAVIHVDGTARMQSVRKNNEPFYSTLKNFYKMTGVPVLLNTSFNIAGEPIVETPQDAIRCFLGTSIDILYLNNLKIEK